MSTENVLNTISKGTVIVGNITTKGDIRVEGKIIGTVTCNSKLVIGENGYVEGNVDARNANISGEVKGTVVIRELLQLHEKGRIVGDIYTQKLAVQIGASFSGSCRMGAEAKSVLDKAPENVEEVIEREAGKIQSIVGNNGRANKPSPLASIEKTAVNQ
ncbi:MAG: polymer-forming cytoskeletal protein [Bacteroidia bacterium]|nr:polymer-forming cytoskeletal protein [Bacteroidia bacterium]